MLSSSSSSANVSAVFVSNRTFSLCRVRNHFAHACVCVCVRFVPMVVCTDLGAGTAGTVRRGWVGLCNVTTTDVDAHSRTQARTHTGVPSCPTEHSCSTMLHPTRPTSRARLVKGDGPVERGAHFVWQNTHFRAGRDDPPFCSKFIGSDGPMGRRGPTGDSIISFLLSYIQEDFMCS